LVSFDHCIVCPSLMYCFLLPLLYLLTIVLNVLLWSTIKEGHTIQRSKDTKEVIRNSRSKNMYVNVQYNTMVKRYQRGNVSYYLFGIFWPLYCMSFFDVLFLITSFISFYHCIVCPSLMYCFLLPLLYLLTIVLYVLLWCTVSNSTSKKDIQYNGQKIPKR
jgi:hypothetical protein